MKYIDADKLRAEIERRKKENMYVDLPMSIGRYYEDRDILSFLDTLEEPVSEDLEEELERRYEQAKWGYVDGFGETVMDKEQFTRIARHFAEWGANHLRDTTGKVPEDLEEAAENSWVDYEYREDPRGLYSSCYIGGFKEGAEWRKRKMMEGAEECELYWDGDFLAIDLNMRELGYSERDKVSIIILPKEEEQ